MSGSVRPFNLYLAGNILHEHGQLFDNVVKFCASRFEVELRQMVQTEIKITATADSEWKSLNEDCDERFFKSWASLNGNKNAYSLALIERKLFFALMEKLCGGDVHNLSLASENRKATAVEWRFHNHITNSLLKNMTEAMSSVATFNIEMLRDPKEVSHAQRIHTNRYGNVMSDIFHVEIGDVSGIIKIEYPATLVRMAMGGAVSRKEAKSRLGQLKDSLQGVPLPVKGSMPMMTMSFDEVLKMKEGDFLPLPDSTTTEVSIGGKTAFYAELRELEGYLALVLGRSVQANSQVAQEK